MKRRTFIVTVTALALSGINSAFGATKKPLPKPKVAKKPVLVATPTPSPSPKPTSARVPIEVQISIDGRPVKSSDLAPPMSAYATVELAGREYKLLIAKPTERTLKIFSARCPHQGTILNLEKKSEFTCDAHGARFDWQTGMVLDGPTINKLEEYEVIIKDDLILIKI
jgi:nitrite reductase/ring-hydroxylating ferredoxin subunit